MRTDDRPPLAVWSLDPRWLVLDKPPGLLSVPGRGPDRADCAAARAARLVPDARIVHRLDQATSGLLIMARGAEPQRLLSMAFEARRMHKRYVAWVTGRPAANEGRIDLPLICDWPNRPRQHVDPVRGRPSTTLWRVLRYDEGADATLLALTPVTGRSHQLRVHLAELGHPILGDDLYASPALAACRPTMALHACELGWDEPPAPGWPAHIRWHSQPAWLDQPLPPREISEDTSTIR